MSDSWIPDSVRTAEQPAGAVSAFSDQLRSLVQAFWVIYVLCYESFFVDTQLASAGQGMVWPGVADDGPPD